MAIIPDGTLQPASESFNITPSALASVITLDHPGPPGCIFL